MGRILNYNYGTPRRYQRQRLARHANLIDNNGVTHLADYAYPGRIALASRRSSTPADSAFPTLDSPFNPDTVVQATEQQPGIQCTLIGIQGGNDPATGDIYRGLDQFSRVKDLIWTPTGCTSRPIAVPAAVLDRG